MVTAARQFEAFNLASSAETWRTFHRIENTGASIGTISDAIGELQLDRLVFAEGDSWFDKFTPIPRAGTNLLSHILTPFNAAVVDVSHIGDEAAEMVSGWQGSRTAQLFKHFPFDAILISAGGNDLKNLIRDHIKKTSMVTTSASGFVGIFDTIRTSIEKFIALRDKAKNEKTRAAPIFVHGYDYFQPRPAGAKVLTFTQLGAGPWLHPLMLAAGYSPVQMRKMADAVIDALALVLGDIASRHDNITLVEHRGLLKPAAADSTVDNADWADEIHPNQAGFTKLARNRWDVPLSRALGWKPPKGSLQAAIDPTNRSTAT